MRPSQLWDNFAQPDKKLPETSDASTAFLILRKTRSVPGAFLQNKEVCFSPEQTASEY